MSIAETIGGQLSEDAFKLFLRSIGIEVSLVRSWEHWRYRLHSIISPILYIRGQIS